MVHKPRRALTVTLPVLALVAALLLFLRPAGEPYDGLLQEGDTHAARAERTAAVVAYREAARLWPDDPEPYLRLARVYVEWGRPDDAAEALAEAERLGAGSGMAESLERERLWLDLHAARGDWDAAEECAGRLLLLKPDDRQARHLLARALVEMQDWDAAQAQYEALLATDSSDALARERLGALLIGEDPQAAQHLYAAQTDLAERLLAVMTAPGVADDPAYAGTLFGRALFEAQAWALSTRHFERALTYNPAYADAHAHLGYALVQMGAADEAMPHLERAVTLDPDSAVAHLFLGLALDRLGDYTAARAAYETAYDLDPANPAACVAIGQTWAAEGRYVAAEIWLVEAVSLRPDDAALWQALTRFYVDHAITAQGRGGTAAEQLVAHAPDDALAHDLRGWAAFQVGDYATAEESLLLATSLDPALAIAHYHLALLREARGERQEAQASFVRALDLDTTGELAPLLRERLPGAP